MAYIGKAPNTAIVNQATSQSFSGNGSTTFTLNRSVNVGEDLEVFVNNVQQEPGSGKSYTASGTTLTFDEAPPSGTNNVYVIYRGEATINPRLEHDANAALAATTGTFTGDLTVDTSTLKVDSTNNRVGIGTTGPTHPLHVIGDVQAENSSGHRALIVKGNSTTNYQGGSLLLANAGMDTNYGGTYLYHHKAGGSGTQNAAFNISQRTAGGAYVSNIWNVDYQNNVQSFYLPNGQQSGASVLTLNSNGSVSMDKQPHIILQGNNGNNITWNQSDRIGATNDGTTAWNAVSSVNMTYASATGSITVATGGVYEVYLQAYFNGGGPSNVRIQIRKNAGSHAMCHNQTIHNGTLHVHSLIAMSANDYIDFIHVSGGDRTFYEGSNHTYAYIIKVA